MRKILFHLILFSAFCAVGFAQEYEYGKPADLKGLTKVHIDAGANVDDFNQIKAEIEKAKLPNLQIVEKPEDADFFLMYAGEKRETVTGSLVIGNIIAPGKRLMPYGKGMVATPGTDGKKLRVLMNFDSKPRETKPAVKFAKEFIKEYKKANYSE